MSTANFKTLDGFDLWAGDDAAWCASELIDEMDPGCMFHRFELVPGYYEGAQIVPTLSAVQGLTFSLDKRESYLGTNLSTFTIYLHIIIFER